MKKIAFMVTILVLFIGILSSCKNWKEVEKKDRALQELIDKIAFEKEIIILEPNYKYLFERFDENFIEKSKYRIQFGEKEYFVGQNDEALFRYALEDDQLDYYLMISIKKYFIAPKGPEISIMIVKKIENLDD